MSSEIVKDLRPAPPRGSYDAALAGLVASSRTRIAHIDSGIAPHPSLGFLGEEVEDAPPNIEIDEGVNFYDPENDPRPISPLRRNPDLLAPLIEYPDHGVKTLSVILGETAALAGVAPRVRVVPYRIANGPLFRDDSGPHLPNRESTAALGRAIDAASALSPPARVMTISMGNPGVLGAFEWLRQLFGGRVGLDRGTGRAVDRAYEAGIIMVCAAGQIIDRVVYPAAYSRTVAVGGFDNRGAVFAHYPPDGYARPELVDIWARAQRINRASYLLEVNPPTPIHADDPRNPEREPSGTSYAAPQVAAAAALWVDRHFDRLEQLFAAERWKIVESFRIALRNSAELARAELRGGRTTEIRVLDIPKLLRTAPPDVAGAPAAHATRQGLF
ncbi:MAG: S8/S53 family peptidase [Pseudomonadota bacterium]